MYIVLRSIHLLRPIAVWDPVISKMNAHALLTSQGWLGTGHALSNNPNALTRPILVSQKQNVLGLGKKAHRTSDMWWQNAFDKSLQGLDTSKDGAVTQTVTNGALDMVRGGGGKWVGSGGLYACFVRGGALEGTVEVPKDRGNKEERAARKEARRVSREKRAKRKEKRDEKKALRAVEKAERRARKEARRAKKAAKSGEKA